MSNIVFVFLYTPFFFIGAMQQMVDSFAAPTEWFINLLWWQMALVGIFSVLGFYLVFRIFFKLIEMLAGLFH